MSVKFKLITWFTIMLTAMAAFVLVVVFVVNDAAITGDPQGSLIEAINDNAEDFRVENGVINWNRLDFYQHGVYTIVYDKDGQVLRGGEPLGLDLNLPLVKDVIRSIEVDGVKYYIYDLYLSVMGEEGIWMRGLIADNDMSYLMHVLIILLWAIIPSILVLSIGGGWLIAWRAFRPITRIVDTAKSISDGDDLTKRIGLKKGSKELKKIAATFDNMLDRLEKSFIAQKQFASDASHELRTPITIMMAECDRAHRKNKTIEDYETTLSSVEEQAQKMSTLIDQLLSLTRIELGAERYPLSRIGFSEFVESVCDEFVPKERRGIIKTTDIEPGINLRCNQTLMALCINNLLQNAYKYGKDGGTVRVSLKSVGKVAELSVTDDGIGIATEDQKKVWDRFWQADASRGARYGSGLGLSLVKEVVELHGGSLALTSKLGEGSKFSIIIPIE